MFKIEKRTPSISDDQKLNGFVADIERSLINNRIVTKDVSNLYVSNESYYDDNSVRVIDSAVKSLETLISESAKKFYGKKKVYDQKTKTTNEVNVSLEEHRVNASIYAGLGSNAPLNFLSKSVPTIASSIEGSSRTVMGLDSDDTFMERSSSILKRLSQEAYNESENRKSLAYTIAFNYQATEQDALGELFFPTITIPPDNAGFTITVTLMMVMNDIKRDISGATSNYNKINIIRAIQNPDILQNDMTENVPVYRTQSANKFISSSLVAPGPVTLEDGSVVTTAPLACGVSFDLLGLSQTDAILSGGNLDVTDSINPAIKLKNVIIAVTGPVTVNQVTTQVTDVLSFSTLDLPYSEFNYAPQGNYRNMLLNFTTNSLVINNQTVQHDGSPLVVLSSITSGNLRVRLQLTVSGTVNTETGDTIVYPGTVSLFSVDDANGLPIHFTDQPAASLLTLFSSPNAVMGGYQLKSYRDNANRRQRGQLIDRTSFNQIYNVPLRSPITALRPTTTDSSNDANDLKSLIYTTRTRTSNQAVAELLNIQNSLKNYVASPNALEDSYGFGPEILGVGRYYVIPTYYEPTAPIDVQTIVNNISSETLMADFSAALVTQIRQYVLAMYVHSQYQAAADCIFGGNAPVPRVIVGTDPEIANYIMIEGDLRTLGNEFDFTVAHTTNKYMKGKIFISFGIFDESRNTSVHPLQFGNMLWSPELTLILPIARDGGISKEVAVQPRFKHIGNLPILSVLTLTNIGAITTKMAIWNSPTTLTISSSSDTPAPNVPITGKTI